MSPDERAEIVKNNPIEDYLERQGIQLLGGGDNLIGQCPFHEEKEHSKGHLSVSVGKQVYHCHNCDAAGDIFKLVQHFEGCTFTEAIEKLGGKASGNGNQPPPPKADPNITAVYVYHDKNGNPLFEVVRYADKSFRQRKPNGDWNTNGIDEKPLYHLPEVLKAETVWVVEGEKDADNLIRLGCLATTCAQGAGKWKPHHTESLRGKNIVICGDTDKPGREHATDIQTAVADVCRSLKRIALPAPSKDISEYLDSQASDFDRIEALARLEQDAPNLGDDIIGASIFDLSNLVVDPNDNLLGNRFLCRGGGMLFVGPSGMGKSSASVQQDIEWSMGLVSFGIRPARPLKIVSIQAEDDDGDLQEMGSGVCKFLKLVAEVEELSRRRCIYLTHKTSTGAKFLLYVERVLNYHRPDLLRLNPLQAYIGADLKDPEKTAAFLRTGLNPLLAKYNCAVIIVHHTPKTNYRDTDEWRASDWMYAGAGSADVTNWARAILIADPCDDSPAHKWIAAKRGKRIGWADDQGNPTTVRYFSHSLSGGIHWVETDENDVPKKPQRKGGSDKRFTEAQLLEHMDFIEARTVGEIKRDTMANTGMSKATFFELWGQLKDSPKVILIDKKWRKVI